MSEELDKIRSWFETVVAGPNGDHIDAGYVEAHARHGLALLDEYERKLVKIEGVEAAYAKLSEGKTVQMEGKYDSLSSVCSRGGVITVYAYTPCGDEPFTGDVVQARALIAALIAACAVAEGE